MRRAQQGMGGDEEDNEINLTPMLDVVFIMLIFFIVTASFIKEAGIDVNRPDAPTSESIADANILIAISSNDEIGLDLLSTSQAKYLRAKGDLMRLENRPVVFHCPAFMALIEFRNHTCSPSFKA